jgi:hypothetical protein
MADFDEEAMEILKAERERASEVAKYDAAFIVLMCAVIYAGLQAWHVVQVIFFGAHFRWSDLWGGIAILVASFIVAWICYRVLAPQEMRDARLIRIELKLDRLLNLRERH